MNKMLSLTVISFIISLLGIIITARKYWISENSMERKELQTSFKNSVRSMCFLFAVLPFLIALMLNFGGDNGKIILSVIIIIENIISWGFVISSFLHKSKF